MGVSAESPAGFGKSHFNWRLGWRGGLGFKLSRKLLENTAASYGGITNNQETCVRLGVLEAIPVGTERKAEPRDGL